MSEYSKDPFSNYIINRYPTSFFVNAELDVLYMVGELDTILSLPSSLANFNLEKMLESSQVSFFREAIAKAFKEDKIFRYSNVVFKNERKSAFVDMTFEKVDIASIQNGVIECRVFFNEVRPFKLGVNVKETEDLSVISADERIAMLETELAKYKVSLRKLQKDQKMRVDEINAQNREMMTNNEELQSTNEELQSVNEELHTVNSELQYKNKELTIANNDINNLLKSTDIGTIFLDKDLRIRRFTPAIKRQFDLIKADEGRLISAFANQFNEEKIEDSCEEVLQTEKPVRKLIKNLDGEEFMMRISPYRTSDKRVEGVVITFVDLSRTKSMLQEFDESIQQTAHRLNAIYENSRNPLLFISPSYIVTDANRKWGKTSKQELIGTKLTQLVDEEYQHLLTAKLDVLFGDYEPQMINVKIDQGKANYQLILIPIQDTKNESRVGSACVIALENTKQVAYLESLERTKETYMSFMENAQHQMVLLDKNGIIININNTRNSPYTRDELIGTVIYDQLPPSEVKQYKSNIEKIFKGGSQSKISFKYVGVDQIEVEATVIASPVLVGDQIAYVALVGNPI
ncbi:PAS domain-containing protein [Portibacter marinus]|uniref:PAS domain-containing protein n=1 Tax=Portibacter marinus TaxID=2898660 RepID=UPI001F305907|nr:PAS domain-containing protein [Portibacter marinus]